MERSEQLQMSMLVGYLVSTLSTGTTKRIESDLQKFKEKYIVNHTENDFSHLFTNPDLVEELPDDLKNEFKNVLSIRTLARQNLIMLKNKLSILIVRAGIEFPEKIDAETAFFACLPDYFNTETFLKSIKDNDGDEVFSTDDVNQITSQSFVRNSEWVKRNTVNQETADALMFFVGTQLLNDIF